jgi:hypothetical protein
MGVDDLMVCVVANPVALPKTAITAFTGAFVSCLKDRAHRILRWKAREIHVRVWNDLPAAVVVVPVESCHRWPPLFAAFRERRACADRSARRAK